ncbi:MAG: gamma-glutamyltransferase, partial [Sphingomonadales bacterium]
MQPVTIRIFASFLMLLAAAALPLGAVRGQEPTIFAADHVNHPVIGRYGMVASQQMLASQVGAEVLAAGGNAVDAAVATAFALAVVLPRAGNLGGGGFMIIHLAEEGRTFSIDYREMAPAAATRDMFLDGDGDVDNEKARNSLASAGVPGTVAGLYHAQKKYGRLKWS